MLGGSAMVDEQLYLFDLQGYVVLKSVLNSTLRESILEFWDRELTDKSLHDLAFTWGPQWRALIDPEPVYTFLMDLFEGSFRLDHAFCVDERFGDNRNVMHHGGAEIEKGIFHLNVNGRVKSGLVGVIFNLLPISSETPTFCCIPGSHKQTFPTPDHYKATRNNPLVTRVALDPGDAVIFSEALTHGTSRPSQATLGKRRAIMLKFCYGYTAYRSPHILDDLQHLAPTPNHAHHEWEGCIDTSQLTSRQKLIAGLPPYHRGRPTLPANTTVVNPSEERPSFSEGESHHSIQY
jgi:hypothetical protein